MELITGTAGKPHVTSMQHRSIFEKIIGKGSYILNDNELLEPELQSNQSLRIRSGMLCHHGSISEVRKNTYDEVVIANGSQSMKRIDLVVARYKKDPETEVETMTWVVIQGTPAVDSPTAPAHMEGNMQDGDLTDDCPVFKVYLEGIQVTKVEKLLNVLVENLSSLNSKIDYTFSSIAWTNPTYDLIEKAGIVYLSYYVIVSDGVAGYAYVVATLPNALKPRKRIRGSAWCASQDGTRHPGNYDINTDGVIKFVAGGPFIEVGFSVCYPI